MKVEILVSFGGYDPNGRPVSFADGDVVEMPAGSDWVKAGFAKKIVAPKKRQSAPKKK